MACDLSVPGALYLLYAYVPAERELGQRFSRLVPVRLLFLRRVDVGERDLDAPALRQERERIAISNRDDLAVSSFQNR